MNKKIHSDNIILNEIKPSLQVNLTSLDLNWITPHEFRSSKFYQIMTHAYMQIEGLEHHRPVILICLKTFPTLLFFIFYPRFNLSICS